MAKPKFTFDTVQYGDAHSGGYGRTVDPANPGLDSAYAFGVRVAKWNRRAASNSLRSTKAWADRLVKAELAAGQIMLEEVESETFPGKIKRIYTRAEVKTCTTTAPEKQTSGSTSRPTAEITSTSAAPSPSGRATRRRKDSARRASPQRKRGRRSRIEKWKRLSAMRTEIDRLKEEYAT